MKKKIFAILASIAVIFAFATTIYAASVGPNKSSISITKGSSGSFTITASGAAGKVTISSSNSSVASVSTSAVWVDNSSETITVYGNGVGSATITVYLADVSGYDGSSLTGKSYTVSVTVSCASHSWAQTGHSDPTCTSNGSTSYRCSACGTTTTDTIAALGHSVAETSVTKEPTCTEEGQKSGTCSRCNQTITYSIPANGHSFGGYIETKAPTCTVPGEETRECTVCQFKETRETELAPHVLGEDRTVIQEATLTEHGVSEGYCVNCGAAFTEETRCQYTDEATGVHFDCDEGIFLTGATIEVTQITQEDASYENMVTQLEEIGGRFIAYKTKAYYENAVFEPKGNIDITFNIPEELGTNVAIMTFDEYGNAQILNSTVDKEAKTVKTTVEQLGSYAIVQISPIIINNIIGGPWVYAGIAEGVAIFILLVSLIVVASKKKKQN